MRSRSAAVLSGPRAGRNPRRPALHLICNAHLDPVWQWRWEEGAAEALATFRTAAEILREREDLVFNHNEAVLYRWVEKYDPPLFREIRRLVKLGRWAIGGGWFLQPDLNLPGLESLARQIEEGRRYFAEKFGAAPRVADNFDSFGHGAGLPQLLVRAGYKMYIHMRPQAGEMALPADLYRWRGCDGSEIPTYRIELGLYHTERGNLERRLEEGAEQALELGRDVAVFWGLGDHGGGATRIDLDRIDAFRRRERRVRVIHGTTDGFYEAIKPWIAAAPVVAGDLQHVFTGCYTSLSRVKRAAQASLGLLTQTEALRAAAWRARGLAYPAEELAEAWRGHLFNDFHDIITGSCVEPAERDALALYGKVEEEARRLRLGAAAALNRGGRGGGRRGRGGISGARKLYVPVTVLNANPGGAAGPVEFECMSDLRPLWTGEWELKVFRLDGGEVESQEEQPEALLPFHDWRRRLAFVDDLPGVGAARYEVRAVEKTAGASPPSPDARPEAAAGPDPVPRALVIEDDADSWGTDRRSYGKIAGEFRPLGPARVVKRGPVRSITESVLEYGRSRIAMQSLVYPTWPVVEWRFRIEWNDERRRLKLAFPTGLDAPSILAEVPGGAIARPADGNEQVHGRWLLVEGRSAGRGVRAALGVVNSGQPGFDYADGAIRLSVLRSAAYCHEQGFALGAPPAAPARKYADLGVHDVRLFVISGAPDDVRRRLPGLADRMSAPPFALAHLPIGVGAPQREEFLALEPGHVRLAALKRADDGRALVVRLQEAAGLAADVRLRVDLGKPRAFRFKLRPYEMKSVTVT